MISGTKVNNLTIGAELQAAGVAGLDFTWEQNGTLHFGPSITAAQQAAIAQVFANHVGLP